MGGRNSLQLLRWIDSTIVRCSIAAPTFLESAEARPAQHVLRLHIATREGGGEGISDMKALFCCPSVQLSHVSMLQPPHPQDIESTCAGMRHSCSTVLRYHGIFFTLIYE